MTEFLNSAQSVGVWAGLIVAALMCLAGIAISCLSLSGTWLVVAAAALVALVAGSDLPGAWTVVIVYAVISGLVEGAEVLSGAWGVKRRGGSYLTGVAAVAGGIAGMLLGFFIPVPLVGNLLGMLAGSFVLAFAVERYRLKKSSEDAADIALGAVMGRVAMILIKVSASLAMTGYLLWRIVGPLL